MDKSQIRRLAIDFAQGHIDYDGYVRERTELIDAIVSGQMPIEREAPRPPKPSKSDKALDPVEDVNRLESEAPPKGLSPLHITIGGAVIALLAVFILYGDDESATAPTPEPPKTLLTPVDPPPASPARKLVDDFVAANSWGTESLSLFSQSWDSLSESERSEAKAAPWFRPLTTALKQEINAQRAIAGLDDSESTRAKGRQLVAFAKSLGVAGPYPSFESDSVSSSSSSASNDVTDKSEKTTSVESLENETESAVSEPDSRVSTQAGNDEASQSESGTKASESAATSTQPAENTVAVSPDTSSDTAAAADGKPSSEPLVKRATAVAAKAPTAMTQALDSAASPNESWLAGLPSDSYALQLFAVKNRAQVDRLLKAHPGHELHVVRASIGDQSLYRVLQAPFTDEASAKAAFNALPEGLKNGQSEPLIRRVASVLTGAIAIHSSTAANTPTPAAQSDQTAPDGYTLQLLASDARDNVERMLRQYPELALRIHKDTNNTSTLRVLYGDFPTADQAKSAIDELPATLIDAVGGRLMVKLSSAPDGDVVTIATRQ